MRDSITTCIISIVMFAMVVGLSVGGWYLSRWWNYTWSYEDQVQATIIEMVEPQYLKPKYRK